MYPMNTPEELRDYKPDFEPHNWTDEDRRYLAPFVTNVDGLVSVITHNLPPEITGALCSRASRAKGSLTEVLLKEYIRPILEGEDKELSAELSKTVEFLQKGGFKKILNNQRAQSFYARWLSQYGDDSIAQLTGTHVVLWGISQLAMKFVEDRRIGLEPLEKSTRYVNFGNKVGDRYLYYIPKPDLQKLGLLEEYRAVMDHLFDTYVELLPKLIEWLKSTFEEKDSVLEKKAFDTLRGLLPMATLGQVALRGNAQAFEYLINRLAGTKFGEFQWLAASLKQELDKEIYSLLLRLEDEKTKNYQEYFTKRQANVRQFIVDHPTEKQAGVSASGIEVKLVEHTPEAEEAILASIFFPEMHGTWEEALAFVKKLGPAERHAVIAAYLPGRAERWYKVGRAFESAYLRFEVTMDIGAYRDLQRHRMMTQERQRFSTHHGYTIPAEIVGAGLETPYAEALDRARALFEKIEALDPELAQYAVPMAYRIRFYQWQNFRQFFWETELRTISQGHPDYRTIEQKKYALFKEKFPLIAGFVLVDMNDYAIARRGTEEKIMEKEKKILERLQKKAGEDRQS
jgi:thymidylate synthase ThyX